MVMSVSCAWANSIEYSYFFPLASLCITSVCDLWACTINFLASSIFFSASVKSNAFAWLNASFTLSLASPAFIIICMAVATNSSLNSSPIITSPFLIFFRHSLLFHKFCLLIYFKERIPNQNVNSQIYYPPNNCPEILRHKHTAERRRNLPHMD